MTEEQQPVFEPHYRLTQAGQRLAWALAWALRWKRLAKRQRARHRNAMALAIADRDGARAALAETLTQSAKLLEAGSVELRRAAADLEGREIQILTLGKEIERWQSRIVEHKQRNRSLNLANQQLEKRLSWLEAEKHEFLLGRGDRTILHRVRLTLKAWLATDAAWTPDPMESFGGHAWDEGCIAGKRARAKELAALFEPEPPR